MPSVRPATIVVVEQSAAVQELVDQALRDNGDFLLVTQNPLEAIEVARRVRIDLLVTELSDSTLVDEVRSLQPDMQVLDLYADGDDPFALVELRNRVAEALAQTEGGR